VSRPEVSAITSVTAFETGAPSVTAPSPPPPVVAATDLPNAAPSTAPPPPRPSPAPRPASPTAPAPPRVDCTPPYTVDSTGHKHWKVQCL
jgi:hypothetical protein